MTLRMGTNAQAYDAGGGSYSGKQSASIAAAAPGGGLVAGAWTACRTTGTGTAAATGAGVASGAKPLHAPLSAVSSVRADASGPTSGAADWLQPSRTTSTTSTTSRGPPPRSVAAKQLPSASSSLLSQSPQAHSDTAGPAQWERWNANSVAGLDATPSDLRSLTEEDIDEIASAMTRIEKIRLQAALQGCVAKADTE